MKFIWFLLPLVFLSCNSSEEGEDEKLPDNFHIEGRITGAANQKILIQAQTDQGPVAIAETKTDANGSYSIDGNIPAPLGLYTFVVGEGSENAIILPMVEGEKVNISGNIKDFIIYPRISGATWAKPLMWYMKSLNDFSTKYMLEENAAKLSEEERLKGKNNFVVEVRKQIARDPGNQANVIMVSALFPNPDEGFANFDDRNLVVLEKMSKSYQKKHSASPITKALVQNIDAISAQLEDYAATTGGTMAAPEISLPNPDGKQLRLSDLKGKVVLIDFWASWCKPCRMENPNVVRLYNKFKNKGFEVFSVSLDDNPEAWKQAIKADGLSWKNHVSDLMGWQSSMVQLYGIQGIPHTVLINREGKIIGLKLRGQQLEQKLEEVLGN
jgi:thiol-disulfide isomerase/thioredoxin